MATTTQVPDVHLQAGARWLTPFLAVIALALLGIYAMLVYPHVSG
jgi:hypothetical protein